MGAPTMPDRQDPTIRNIPPTMKIHADAIDPLHWLGTAPGLDSRRAETVDAAGGLAPAAAAVADAVPPPQVDPAENLFALDVWAQPGGGAGPSGWRLLPTEPALPAGLPDAKDDAAGWAEAAVAHIFDALG